MVLSFEEMKELEEQKHKHFLEQVKAKNESLVLEASFKSVRLDKLIEFVNKKGDLRMMKDD